MKIKIAIITCIALFTVQHCTYAQTNKEKAQKKGEEAIALVDKGNFEEGIKLLEEAQKLDPDEFIYPYEIAYAYYAKKDYKETIKILEKNETHKNVTEHLFQLLGNSYDMSGKSDKALDAYDAGLKKFPRSGKLYLEKGNVFWQKKEYEKALPYYEKGIEVEPQFPSNYYRAARVYCASTEEVWGMLYGEIFMNTERNTKRTEEISKLLFDTYKSEIKFTSDSSMTVSFCQQMFVNANSISDTSNFKLPFCMIYEPTLLMAILFHEQIDINSLDKIRTNFVKKYFEMGNNKKYPNLLFDYQDKILKAGHMEAYNHWILMKGDEDGFEKWHEGNKEKWDNFVAWFKENKLKIDESNKFLSNQY